MVLAQPIFDQGGEAQSRIICELARTYLNALDLLAWPIKHQGKLVARHVMRLFSEWDSPGNVRELENVVERSVITTGGTVLKLPKELGRASSPLAVRPGPESRSMIDVERHHILEVVNWQVAGSGGAAEVLKLHGTRCGLAC